MDDEEDGPAHIANMSKPADEVRRDFGRNPKGWHDFSPNDFVAHLANIGDIGCGSLRVLSENRDSASRVPSC
ncbi:MAG TPA: hypothetical protein VLN59_10225 [Burkholderiales bacterium]|nr:hypothetical protein [Burkholderiales bacterium]